MSNIRLIAIFVAVALSMFTLFMKPSVVASKVVDGKTRDSGIQPIKDLRPPVKIAKTVDYTIVYTNRITRKYLGLKRGEVKQAVGYAMKYASKYSLEPALLLGLMAAESSFNPTAVSPMGAVGYTQVMPKYHQDKIKGRRLTNASVNIQVGAKILRQCMNKHKSRSKALGCYNGATDPKDVQRYVKHVMRHVQMFS